LAEALGTDFETVSRWERGISIPNAYFREKLRIVFDKTAEELGLMSILNTPLPTITFPLAFLASAYADAEKEAVIYLKAGLQARGISMWSSRQLRRQGAETPKKALQEAISAAQMVLVILSPLARSSRHVRETLSLARRYQRPVWGVWIEGEHWQECLPQDAGILTALVDVRQKEEGALLEEIIFALKREGLASSESSLSAPAVPLEHIPESVAIPASIPADIPFRSPLPGTRQRRSFSRSASIMLVGVAMLIIGGAILGGIELARLSKTGERSLVPAHGGIWIDELGYDIDSLIPNTGFIISSNILVDNALYLPLFYGDDGTGVIYPGAATEVPSMQNGGISADARTWIFHLKPHLVWSDGQPYDARDVDYSWKLWANPRLGTVYSTGVNQIASADVSVDHLAITFHLKRAYAPFLQFWVNGFAAPLPAHHFEKTPPEAVLKSPDLLNPQVTSGPFLMKGSVPGDHYTLARNPRFYRASEGLPYLARVVFRIRDDQDTILKDLQMGSITSAHPLDYSKLAEYRRLSNYVLTTALTSSSFEALFFNFHNRVLSTHLEVRLAMAEAIDHKALIAGLPQGHGVPLCTDHGSFYHPGYQPQPDCPVFDSAAANKLLDDNGWVRGTDGVRARQGQRLDFEYVTTLVTAPWRTAVGALIQRNLKEIGIKFDVQYYPLREAYKVVVAGKASPPTGAVVGGYDIVEANEYLPGYDPDDSSVLGCDSFLSKGGNVSFYCNPTLEALYKQEQETTDAGVRQQIFNQIHEIYLTDFPIIVLYGWIEFTIARKLDFVHFQLPTGRIKQSIQAGRWKQCDIAFPRGCLIALGQPDLAAQAGEHIVKGGVRLVIPSRLLDLQAARPLHLDSRQGHQAVQAEQERSTPLNGQIGPLALGFDAQMGTALLKGGFQRPAMHKRRHDRFGRERLIGTQQRLDGTFARRITSQHPANGQGRMANAIPEGGATAPLNDARPLAVPLDLALLPRGGGIGQDRFQRGQPLADHLRFAATATLLRGWRRGMQHAVEPSGGDQGDTAASGDHAQFQATVGGIPQHANLPVGQPAVKQAHHLPSTLADGVMPQSQLLAHAGRRR